MAVGLNVFLQGLGTFTVAAINSPTSVLLTYLNILTNTQAGSPIPLGTLIVPSGIPGVAGQNAYTVVASPGFTTPSIYGAPATIPVANAQWLTVGQSIYVQGAGNFIITSIDNTANPPTVTATYPNVAGNLNLNTPISAGAGVSASAFEPLLPTTTGYRLASIVYLNSPTTTYVPTAGTNSILVECVAGGGSGGGGDTAASAASMAGGGGSGSYSSVFIATPAVSYTIQVGAGGASPAAGNNPGNPGTDTLFAETVTPTTYLCRAKAGGGGSGGGAADVTNLGTAGGAGGLAAAAIGDVRFDGNDGGNGIRLGGVQGTSGFGAGSIFGGERAGNVVQADGVAGGQYGAGGSGGMTSNGGAATIGGAGAAGVIKVTEYV
jgi:hypothetical protein